MALLFVVGCGEQENSPNWIEVVLLGLGVGIEATAKTIIGTCEVYQQHHMPQRCMAQMYLTSFFL